MQKERNGSGGGGVRVALSIMFVGQVLGEIAVGVALCAKWV